MRYIKCFFVQNLKIINKQWTHKLLCKYTRKSNRHSKISGNSISWVNIIVMFSFLNEMPNFLSKDSKREVRRKRVMHVFSKIQNRKRDFTIEHHLSTSWTVSCPHCSSVNICRFRKCNAKDINSNSPNNNNNKIFFICMHRIRMLRAISHMESGNAKKIDYYMGHVKCLRFFFVWFCLRPSSYIFLPVNIFFAVRISLHFFLHTRWNLLLRKSRQYGQMWHIGVNETKIMVTTTATATSMARVAAAA